MTNVFGANRRVGGAKVAPLTAILWAIAGGTGCSEEGLAKTHVFDNGPAGSALPPPATVVPAKGSTPELAYYRIDNSRLQGLKSRLVTALAAPPDLDGARGYNAMIALNLDTAGAAAAGAADTLLDEASRCQAGLTRQISIGKNGETATVGNGCMFFLDGQSNHRLRLFDFFTESDVPWRPIFDASVRGLGPAPATSSPLTPLGTLAPIALRERVLTSLGNSMGLLSELMPVANAAATDPAERIAKNLLIKLRFAPEELMFGSPALATKPGLYMPIDLDFTGGAWTQTHFCTETGGDSVLCDPIRKQLDQGLWGSCSTARFATRVNRLRVWVGLVPSLRPGCTNAAGSLPSDDTLSGWMQHLPFTEPYRQGCLQVETNVVVDVNDATVALASSPEQASQSPAPITLWAAAEGCTGVIGGLCGVIDCDELVRDKARATVQKRIRAVLPEALKENVDTFLRSEGSAFANGPPAYCSLSEKSGACALGTVKQLLPASVARLEFGFFANAFPNMPIVGVDNCDPGTSRDTQPNPWNACCPPGMYGHMDGYCSKTRPPADRSVCEIVPPLNPPPPTSPGPPTGPVPPFDPGPPDVDGPTLPEGPMPVQPTAPANCFGRTTDGAVYEVARQPWRDAVYFKVENDRDGDGLVGSADFCPLIKGGAIDTDGDGAGDLCDPCPCSIQERFADQDGDRVCSVACPGSTPDNCPFVANPNQRNINRDAEQYSKGGPNNTPALPYGDACEPVPVPEFDVNAAPSTVVAARCRQLAWNLEQCSEAWINSDISFTPQGSHPTGDKRDSTAQASAGEIQQDGLTTTAYFCVPGPNNDCSAPKVSGNDAFTLTASDTDTAAIYRFAKLRPAGGGPLSETLPPVPYFASTGVSHELVWDGLGDLARWRAQSWGSGLADPSAILDGPTPQPGRLWFHTTPTAGTAALPGYHGAPFLVGKQVGFHRLDDATAGYPEAEANLANAYWGGWPVEAKRRMVLTRYKENLETIPVPPCIECKQPTLPRPDDCLVCSLGRSPTDGRAVTIPVLVDPFNPLVIAAPDGAGSFRDVRNALSPRVLAAMATPHRLVAATDPTPTGEAASRRPLAVLLAPRGNAVVETLYGGSLALGVRADVAPTGAARLASPPPSVAAGTPPAPWSTASGSFVTTYNRQQGELFVVSAKVGQRAGEVWAHDVENAAWTRLALTGNVRLEQPIAAVFLPNTNALWVLDEGRAGFARMARLLRIDRTTGVVTVVTSYPRLGVYDSQYLLEDRDGRLLVAASSRWLGAHALVSFDGNGAIVAFGFAKGALAAPPIVDGEGYTFQLRTKQGGLVSQRLDVLPMRPGPHHEAHGCF
jgi:hypothetical protein